MKKYLIIISVIFVFIIVTIGLASNIETKEEKTLFYAYVKDNNLVLWNEKNNQKYILNSNIDIKNGPLSNDYFNYSFDNSKIIYTNKTTDKGVDLYFANITNLKQSNNTLIDTEVLSYQVVLNGIVYLKGTSLFYYDYNISQEIVSDVVDYAVTNDKKELYYCLTNGDVYQINLENLDQKTKILSNITGLEKYEQFVLVYKKEDIFYSFYIDNKLISDKALNVLGVEEDAFYFIQYEGSLTKVESTEDLNELNSNVATYRYQNGEVTKLGVGILAISPDFTNVSKDEYLVFGKYNGQTFDISLYNQKDDYLVSLGNTSKFNFYAYDDTTKTIYYRGEDNLFYQANIVGKELKNEKVISENVGSIAKKNGNIYYVANNNLHLLQDENILIAENINDWFVINNDLYYTKNDGDKTVLSCYQCNMNEINNIASLSIIDNQIFYFADTYLKENILYGNLYTIINNVNVLVDNDVIISFGVTSLNNN